MTQKKDIYNKGAAMLIAVIFFLFLSMTFVLGVANPILKQASVSKNIVFSTESYYLANGAIEDAIYRIQNGKNVVSGDTSLLNGYTATLTVTPTLVGKTITASSDRGGAIRNMEANVTAGVGAAFNYGIQSGQGGFILENSASITGNVYSAGSITGSGNDIYGDAVSTGPSGLIDDIHTTGSAYAHTISNSDVDKDAYYVTKTNTTVGGFSYPNSADQATVGLPITDDQIDDLESDAAAGGSISSPCPYKITANKTLGPIKINCDLEISGSPTVTLMGSVWVSGNISIKNSAIVRVSSSLGNQSVALIADKVTSRSTSSTIEIENTSQFLGSGSTGSFVFLISRNNSAESGGTVEAISMDNSSSGSVTLYAPHGLITINNSATLKEVTGYKIKAKNTANIVYDTGLANTIFTSGPAGGYQLIDWKEVK